MDGCTQLWGGALVLPPWVLGMGLLGGGTCGVMPTLNRQVLGQVFPIRASPSLVPISTRHAGAPKVHHDTTLPTQADPSELAPL